LLAHVLGGDDPDGDVPGAQVVLEPVEDAPAVDVGQAQVEGDGGGFVVAHGGQGAGGQGGHHPLEALLAGGLQHQPAAAQVVLDDEDPLARLDGGPVVAHLVDQGGGLGLGGDGRGLLARRQRGGRGRDVGELAGRPGGVVGGQEEGEGAAPAGGAD